MVKMKTIPMARRKDLPIHTEDAIDYDLIYKRDMEKLRKCNEKQKQRKCRKQKPQDDSPWIEDKDVWNAVSFARHMVNNNDDDMGLAIYKAAKYYKVDQHEVAMEMGKFANHVKAKKKIWREN